eukprot:g13535.t1
MVTFVHRLRTSDPTSAGGGGGTGMAAPAAVEETQRLLTRQPGEAPTEGRPLPRFTLPRPGFCQQCGIVLQRRFAMFMRETWRRMVDLGLVFLCSSGIGVMHRGGNGANSLDLPGNLHMFFIGLALLSAVSSLKVFGENRPMFWRESANGISLLRIYFILTRPPVPYMDYFIPGLLVAFAAASWGYLSLGRTICLPMAVA